MIYMISTPPNLMQNFYLEVSVDDLYVCVCICVHAQGGRGYFRSSFSYKKLAGQDSCIFKVPSFSLSSLVNKVHLYFLPCEEIFISLWCGILENITKSTVTPQRKNLFPCTIIIPFVFEQCTGVPINLQISKLNSKGRAWLLFAS